MQAVSWLSLIQVEPYVFVFLQGIGPVANFPQEQFRAGSSQRELESLRTERRGAAGEQPLAWVRLRGAPRPGRGLVEGAHPLEQGGHLTRGKWVPCVQN